MNIALHLQRQGAARPRQAALAQGDVAWTYGQLADRVARLAGFFRARGLVPGDRVGIALWNAPAAIETMFAAFHAGLAAVPLNARATPHEARQLFEDTAVSAVVHDAEHAPQAEAGSASVVLSVDGLDAAVAASRPLPLCDVPPDAVAWLFSTSGTTGRMKAASLTHRNLVALVVAYLADIRRLAPGDRVLHAAPLSHGSGLYALPAVARGTTQILTSSRSFDPEEILRALRRDAITDIAFLAPTMIRRLVEAAGGTAFGPGALRNVVYGGAPMYVEDLRAALATFGPVFTQIYGQAEAPMTIARLTRADHELALAEHPERLLSTGQAFTTVDVGVRAPDGGVARAGEGEIVVRGDVVMAGYWHDEAATATALRDGRLGTGDLGRIDESGFVYLLDRSKDVIISGGANIYPREVEEVLLEHPAVRQVAVVGAPDDEWGERVVAVLAAAGGADRGRLEEELDALCRERLSGYKRPRRYEWLDELPTSAYGKILKRELRETFWAGRERRI